MKNKAFSPQNSGTENTTALQASLDEGGLILIDSPGIYDIEDTLFLSADTELIFAPGVLIRRTKSSKGSFAFTNRGAFIKKYDENITIRGLHLITNGVEARVNAAIYGMTGELSFFYVKKLRIYDFECLDLPKLSFAIQICTFEDLIIERIKVEGRKDAVHLGKGSKFVIRHGLFRTYDDPIALNAHDYSVAVPELGWIEDGLIEDCYDLADDETVGFFCRILAGAWVDWFEGMEIQQSDTVVYNGRVYRAFQKPDGTLYTSKTAPTHTSGMETLDDINWVMLQEGAIYNCGCRNIHFRDIHLQKKRSVAFSIHFDQDMYSRSYYPNAQAPIQRDLIFENIYFDADIKGLISANTPINSIKLINSVMCDSQVVLRGFDISGLVYPLANILMSGTTFKGDFAEGLISCDAHRSCKLKILGSMAEEDNFSASVCGKVDVVSSDIPLGKTKE